MIAIRVGLVTIALAACAWFALGIRAVHDQGAATALLNQHNSLTPGQARAAKADLTAAETLNPDQALEIERAQVEFHSGNVSGAMAIAKRVVAGEPENVEAWLVLELISRRIDPATNRLAQTRVSQLVSPAT